MSKRKKPTNKEMQIDIITLYQQTKEMYQNLLYTIWSYIEWKGDKADFNKFCEEHNKRGPVNDKKTNGGQNS